MLHTIQISSYVPILQEARRFPGDEVACETLADYELALQDYIERLRLVTSRPTFAVGETDWIEDIIRAREELGAGRVIPIRSGRREPSVTCVACWTFSHRRSIPI